MIQNLGTDSSRPYTADSEPVQIKSSRMPLLGEIWTGEFRIAATPTDAAMLRVPGSVEEKSNGYIEVSL